MTTIQAESISAFEEGFAFGADGTRLYVQSQSAPASHAPNKSSTCQAILCDGLLCDGYIWKYLWPAILPHRRVSHWHYRGHGRSGLPVDPQAIHIPDHARDLNHVRSYLQGHNVVLFGHSMGCQVALEAYRMQPENVRAMVLLCGTYGKVTETFRGSALLSQVLPRIIERVVAVPHLARALWSRIPPEMVFRLALLTGEIDKSVRREDLLPYLSHMTHVDLPIFLRMLQAAGEHTAEDVLASVTCPVLVVAGERDSFTPPFLAETMASLLPQAEYFLVAGGTHIAPLEQHDLVNARIEAFLQEHHLLWAGAHRPSRERIDGIALAHWDCSGLDAGDSHDCPFPMLWLHLCDPPHRSGFVPQQHQRKQVSRRCWLRQ